MFNICFSSSKILKFKEGIEIFWDHLKNTCIKLADIFEEQAENN